MAHTKTDLIEARLRNLAAFSFGPLEPYGDMVKLSKITAKIGSTETSVQGVYRLPVKREVNGVIWLGSIEMVNDSDGNPNSVHLTLSLS